MKKIINSFVVLLIIFSIVSCSGNINTETNDDSQPPIETPSDENTTTPETTPSTPSTDVPSTPPETPSEDNPSTPPETPSEDNPSTPIEPEEPNTPPEETPGEENPENPVTPPEDEVPVEPEEPQISQSKAYSLAGPNGLRKYTLYPNTTYDNKSAETSAGVGKPIYAYCFTGTTDENGSGIIETKIYFEGYFGGQESDYKIVVKPSLKLEGPVKFVNGKIYDISEAKVWVYSIGWDWENWPPTELNSTDKELINNNLQAYFI